MQAQNTQLLFHGSGVRNFLGILSRGLMLPKKVKDIGGKRTDFGMLGAGIYFSDSISASIKYCHPGKKGTRLLVVAEVNLGRIKETTEIDPNLSSAPEGYDSVHALPATSFRDSHFVDDEYVIYNSEQQQLRYLVEFTSDYTPPPQLHNPVFVGANKSAVSSEKVKTNQFIPFEFNLK